MFYKEEKATSRYIPSHLRSSSSSEEKKDKSHYFKCNAPDWKPSHKCKDKKLFHCEIDNSDSDRGEVVGDKSSSDTESDSEGSSNLPEPKNHNENMILFVVAMTGIAQSQTLKVHGYVKKTKVVVLIDCGNSHNFIDTKIAKQLNIFIYPTS